MFLTKIFIKDQYKSNDDISLPKEKIKIKIFFLYSKLGDIVA